MSQPLPAYADEPPAPIDGEHHSGQVRIAYRLAAAQHDRLMHVHGIGWHHYDGTRWVEDKTGIARRAVIDTISEALRESEVNGDKTLRTDATKCESANGVEGVLKLAAALTPFAFTVDDLDADPGLLNVANGTLDLRTRQLRWHTPGDRLTKITRGAYNPGAEQDTWRKFLQQVLPDPAERAYLQRVIGQALYGRVTEHLLPILIGSGANGKGTAYGAVIFSVGTYGAVIDPQMLMAKPNPGNGGANPELMDLLGARLVIGSETEEGRKLDEAVMKRLTGGDQITARRLYRDTITWTPSHTLLYVTNHLPSVRADDPAVWRRVRVIPFDVVVPPEDRDVNLPARLELEADAVLTWAIEGYEDYADNGGMREPPSVLRATDAYQAESDAVRRFIEEACHTGPASTATTRELYAAWQRWAIADGADPLTEKAFAKELDRRDYEAKRSRRGMLRQGIAPYATDDEPGEGW